MADPNDVHEIEACGKTWKLHYNNRAFREIENELKTPISKIEYGFHSTTVMLLAGLRVNHREATMIRADAIIDELGLEAVVDIVAPAVLDAAPFGPKSGDEQ